MWMRSMCLFLGWLPQCGSDTGETVEAPGPQWRRGRSPSTSGEGAGASMWGHRSESSSWVESCQCPCQGCQTPSRRGQPGMCPTHVQSAVEHAEEAVSGCGPGCRYAQASLTHRVLCRSHSYRVLAGTDRALTRSPVPQPHPSEPEAHLPSMGVKCWLSQATSPRYLVPVLRSRPVLPCLTVRAS